MPNQELLRRDVRLLGDLLGEVICESQGPEALRLVQEVRNLARARRSNSAGAEAELAEKIESLTGEQIHLLCRALGIFFDLSNLAEDRHRIRVLRHRETERHPAPTPESIGAAIEELHAAGLSAAEVQDALHELDVELVFTAHPSEAKRRSIRSKLRHMRQCLLELDRPDLLPRERTALEQRLRADLTVLWQTEFLRPMRPSVLEEVERGLSIVPRLWEVVPQIHDALRSALARHYPQHVFQVRNILRFGSWMGGDRDGHPEVTAEVTEQTLLWLRDAAIEQHLILCRQLFDFLTVSIAETEIDHSLERLLNEAMERWPEFPARVSRVAPREVYRRWIRLIAWRLECSRCASLERPLSAAAYRNGSELEQDLTAMAESLRRHHGQVLWESELLRWLDLTRTFGLHLARLDVRQDARQYRGVLAELLAHRGACPNYLELPEEQRLALLTATLDQPAPPPESPAHPLTQDTLRLFSVVRHALVRLGEDVIGGHVISMTRYPSDILGTLWLYRQACLGETSGLAAGAGDKLLRIVPLFEKIGDLRAAPQTLAAILDHPVYQEHLASQQNRQIVMVGYSDSTKDGGYLAACWGLYKAQAELQQLARERGVRLTFFHGRGGSLGRGGGPAARGILSLPPDALRGSLRLTEQGEVLAERYDDVHIAYRHLEQVTWATLVATRVRHASVRQEWSELMDRLAETSREAYRELIDQPDFMPFFLESTPIDEIENLPIGSRPARRSGARALEDLRAIPWVFAWTQNRCIIPAWYGIGTVLTDVKYRDRIQWQTICEMYREWPFFRATFDNAALALAKADMYIGQRYAELCSSESARQAIWVRIASERDRARQAILDLVGGTELLADTPWFQGSVAVRNPSIDPLNLMQIELLRRRRELPADAPLEQQQELRDLLRLTIQGIAAGMRTTG